MGKLSSTGVSKEKLENAWALLGNRWGVHHLGTVSRLYRRMYEAGDITFNELAFLDIDNWQIALLRKVLTVKEANEILSESSDDLCVMVPLGYMITLMAHWRKYVDGPPGMSFGEAFGFEGGGQGGQNTRGRTNHRVRSLNLAIRVVVLRYECEHAGNPISLDAAYASVVDETGASVETVRRAYKKYGKKYGKYVFEEMKLDGVIDEAF